MTKTNKEITMELCKGFNGNLERLLSYLIDDELDITVLTTSKVENQMKMCIETETLLYSMGVQYIEDILKAINFTLNNLSTNKDFYNGKSFSTRVDYVFNTSFNHLRSNNTNIFTQALHFVNKNKDLYKGLDSQHISKLVFLALFRIAIKDCGVVPFTKSVPDNVRFYRTTKPNKVRKNIKNEKLTKLPEKVEIDKTKVEQKEVESTVTDILKGAVIPEDKLEDIIKHLAILGYKIEKEEEPKMEKVKEVIKPVIDNKEVYKDQIELSVGALSKMLESMQFTLTTSEKNNITRIITNNIDLFIKYDCDDFSQINIGEFIKDIVSVLSSELTNDTVIKLISRLITKFGDKSNLKINQMIMTNLISLVSKYSNKLVELLTPDNIKFINDFITTNKDTLMSLFINKDFSSIRSMAFKYSLDNSMFKSCASPAVLLYLDIVRDIRSMFPDDEEDDTDVVGNMVVHKPTNLVPVTTTDTSVTIRRTVEPVKPKEVVKPKEEKLLGFAALNNMIKTKSFSFI